MEEYLRYNEVYRETIKEKISEEFTRLKDECYLDHAGATLYSEKQISDICNDFQTNLYGNPHSLNMSSKFCGDSIDQIRYRILDHFNTTADEYSVIFTSGATAALKLIGENFKYCGNTNNANGLFVYTRENHTSVLGMREYAKYIVPITQNDLKLAMSLKNIQTTQKNQKLHTSSLFVFPAQCNFSGAKFPLSWVSKIQNGYFNHLKEENEISTKWFCMLDAACFVSTNKLDLSQVKPDFVCMSFYKIFGYPTGLGALLIKNSSANTLNKVYFGGGTVQISMSNQNFHVFRSSLQEKFEDGTISFLSILSLLHSFNSLQRLELEMDLISQHVFSLAKYVHHSLNVMHHSNGSPAALIYCDTNFEDSTTQGGIVNFNLLRPNGDYVGYSEVLHMANLHQLHLRTGCFCNPGACQRYLKLSDQNVKKHFEAGHICGDQHDLINGVPTGSVRISFGYMSRKSDADKFLAMIEKCFVHQPIILQIPSNNKHQQYKNTNKKIQNGIYVQNQKSSIQLLKIFIYPIKSCGAYTIDNYWEFGSSGLKYDREWMIVTSNGVCLTQKHEPRMCLIKPTINLKQKFLILTYPHHPSISLPLELSENQIEIKKVTVCQSKVCRDNVNGIDYGEEVSKWLENVLGILGVRLIQQNQERFSKKNQNLTKLSLVNEAQFLLINAKNIEWLVDLITDCDIDLSLESIAKRFRPNFLIRSESTFEELQWSKIEIDNNIFSVEGVCTRCQMVCIDQESGQKTIEPLRTLAANLQGKLKFGIYLKIENINSSSTISTGSHIRAF